uniref:IS1491 transposase istB n=2 Tax=Pseudomonas TaxID=286 RepID=A0A223Q362_PSEPU|nr:IS1491 transposase istB [Pseudomonas putida]UVN18697.1 IS1491 transposase istB [Pseudomonas aeruginosa]
MEESAGAHRLPRRGRWALLLGAVSTGEEAAGGAPDGAHRRVFPRQPASGQPPALNAQGPAQHAGRAHAQEPSRACRVDATTADPLGRADRAEHRRRDPAHPRTAHPSAAGLPGLPGHPAPGQNPRRSAPGVGLPSRHQPRHVQLQEPRIDPAPGAGEPAAGPAAPAPAAGRPRQPARPRLLPLNTRNPTMLPHPTLDKLQTLRLHGMLKALNEQLKTPDIDSLSFEERLGLLVDRELTERDDKRLSSRLRQARLKHNACLEDIDYRSPRGLDKALILQLSGGHGLRDGLNLIIGGPTGVGKTWLACALAHQACREGYSVRYLRLPRLLEELGLAHGDGRFAKLMSSYAKTDLLILDDWGLARSPPNSGATCWSYWTTATASARPSLPARCRWDNWHELIGDPTLADAILDRLVHNAYRINLKGESMRKRTQKLTTPANPD